MDFILDQRVSAIEREISALGVSAGIRTRAAAQHRECSLLAGAKAVKDAKISSFSRAASNTAAAAPPTSANTRPPAPANAEVFDTRKLLGYSERFRVRDAWRNGLAKLRESASPKNQRNSPGRGNQSNKVAAVTVKDKSISHADDDGVPRSPAEHGPKSALRLATVTNQLLDSYRLAVQELKSKNQELLDQVSAKPPHSRQRRQLRKRSQHSAITTSSQVRAGGDGGGGGTGSVPFGFTTQNPAPSPISKSAEPSPLSSPAFLGRSLIASRPGDTNKDVKDKPKVGYIIRRMPRRQRPPHRHEPYTQTGSRCSVSTAALTVHELTTAPAVDDAQDEERQEDKQADGNWTPEMSTLAALRGREGDLRNVFFHYCRCDRTVTQQGGQDDLASTFVSSPASTRSSVSSSVAESARDAAANVPASKRYFWDIDGWNTFLREFEMNKLFSRRRSTEVFVAQAEGGVGAHVRHHQGVHGIRGLRLSFPQFMWCLCNLSDDLPFCSPVERARLILAGLDTGIRQLAVARDPLAIAPPAIGWLKRGGQRRVGLGVRAE